MRDRLELRHGLLDGAFEVEPDGGNEARLRNRFDQVVIRTEVHSSANVGPFPFGRTLCCVARLSRAWGESAIIRSCYIWLRVRDLIPAGRFGRPEEFGAFAAFLCSSQAGYLTGQNIVLDWGA